MNRRSRTERKIIRATFFGGGARSASARGQSIVELAVVLPFVVVMLIVIGDYARAGFLAISLTDAARAGAQYGAQSHTYAVNSTAIEQAACNSMLNVSCSPGTNATTTSFCQCAGSTSTVSCTNRACNLQNFVQVTTSATFTTLVSYPGLPHTLNLTATSTMQVQ